MKTIRFLPRTLALALPMAALISVGCFDDDDDDGILGGGGDGRVTHAMAEMRGYTDSAIFGTVRLDESGDALLVTAIVNGLEPGKAYGIHVHQFGNCSAPELSGPHFHQDETHGNPNDTMGPSHRGDLPNLVADANGVGHLSFTTSDIDLETSARSVVNRSVVLHANADDYVTQPDGGAGPRIACGVIQLTAQGGTDTTGTGGTGTGGTDTTGTGGTGTGPGGTTGLPPYP